MKIFKKINSILFLSIFSIITLSACNTPNEPIDSSNTVMTDDVSNSNISKETLGKNDANSEIINSDSPKEGNIMTKINIKIGDKIFSANLLNNKSTQELILQMPLTLNMTDLYGNEKYYNLPNRVPTNTEKIGHIQTGDLMLYGADCLVLFYDDFNTSYSYTRLGKIEDTTGLVESLGSGNVEITFKVAD